MQFTILESNHKNTDGEPFISHQTSLTEDDVTSAQALVNLTIDKSVELIPLNINDESLYLLCQWEPEASEFSVILTDDTKSKDSRYIARCDLSGLSQDIDNDTIQYWTKDHLSTCSEFFRFSLVALYSAAGRQQTVLL